MASADHHPFYGHLVNHHLKTILNSGLLLDEDLEVLLANYHTKRPPRESLCSHAKLKLVPAVLVCGGMWRRYNTILPGLLVAGALVCFEIKNRLRRSRQKDAVNKVKEGLIRTRRQNAEIASYLKTRTELGQKHKYLDNAPADSFAKTVVKIEIPFFEYHVNTLSHLANLCPKLREDFASINGINLSEINHEVLRDLHVLFSSKFLSYLGIVLCSDGLTIRNLEDILDVRLPKLLERIQQRHKAVHEKFSDLRYSSEIKSRPHRNLERGNVTARLHNTLVQSVDNLCIIMEKSRSLLNKMEQDDNNIQDLGSAIVDIRDHTLATYETLDVLCKLYGILSNAKPKVSGLKPLEPRPATKADLEIVNYDDSAEPREERYELFIGKNDKPQEVTTTRYEDNSEQYLSLMLRELKQSLKQHERFISAKNKRDGSSSEEEIEPPTKIPPTFDLRALERPPVSVEVIHSEERTDQIVILPPPPLAPNFNLSDLKEETGRENSRSMLQNIKALSSQIKVKEEVFGDNLDDSDCSDEV